MKPPKELMTPPKLTEEKDDDFEDVEKANQ